jgi:type III restriction enzyme
MSDLQLKKAEELKIEYAKKHFEALWHTDIKYDMVNSYQDMLDKVL